MNFIDFHRVCIVFIMIFMLGVCFLPFAVIPSSDQSNVDSPYLNESQILFAPRFSTTTYLIQKNGFINHTWQSNYWPGECVYLLEDGTLIRAAKLTFYGDGSGGCIQKISWDGSLLWNYTYYSDYYLSHHDLELLPNGNILAIAWEYKTRQEAIENGRDPDRLQGNLLMPDHIIEIQQTGQSSGNIVWEWHLWDHLIQDFDASKDNYGVVEEHPELVDINFGSYTADWTHTNSIDYSEKFDQILLTIRNFDEIWVIDHSTTSQEAKGHSGGNSGQGGDILYRWGNPRAYQRGDVEDQKLFDQHDANWIESGCPGEGNILIFNNGVDRPEGEYSSVDEIIPPVDSIGNYFIEPDFPYGPEDKIWTYTDENPTNFYSNYVGGAERLRNGNTIICEGSKGKFFEVNYVKEKLWEYINPFPSFQLNDVFKIQYLPSESEIPDIPDLECEGAIDLGIVKPGSTVSGSFILRNIGDPNSLLNWKIEDWPSWGYGTSWTFNPEFGEDLLPEEGNITVQVSCVVPDKNNRDFSGRIKIENTEDQDDYEYVDIILSTIKNKSFSLNFYIFSRLFERFTGFSILCNLLGI